MGEPATAASDRYSLAVVAYELLTGSRPFEGSHFAVQARAHVEDPPPPPSSRNPDLSAAVDAVLERALAKYPGDRYGSAAGFADALGRALEEPRTAPTRRLGRRGARGAAAGAGAAAAAAGDGAARPDAGGARRRREAAAAPRSATDEWRRGAGDAAAAEDRNPALGDGWSGGGRRVGTVAGGERPHRRASAALLAAVAGLFVVAVVAVAVLASRGGGGGGNHPVANDTPRAQHTAEATKTASPDKTATATASPTDSPAPTDTPAPDQTVSGAPDLKQAAALQLEGYNARQAGNYATALDKSRAALAACGDTHQLSPCGYALYEEGVALNRSGNSAAAIPILQQRLEQYGDDGSGSVAKELRDAQKRAGQKPRHGKKPKDSHD